MSLVACSAAQTPESSHVDALPVVRAEARMRIGDFEDAAVGFTRVGGVDVDHEGNVYALEITVPEIRVFSPEGALLGTIGGSGGGPGEFQMPPRFGVQGDTVWAVEGSAKRMALFHREGTVLATGRVEDVVVGLPSGFGYILPHTMRPDGKFTGHLSMVSFSREAGETGVDPSDQIPVPLVLFDAQGRVTDTIGWAERPPPRMWRPPSEEGPRPEMIEVGGRRWMVPAAPWPLPWWVPLDDGHLRVETPRAQGGEDGVFTVIRTGLHGDTIFRTEIHYVPVPFVEEDLDSIAVWAARGDPRGMTSFIPGQPAPPDWEAIAARLRAEMDFPSFRLPIRYPWLAQDGSLWLQRTVGADSRTVEWIILAPEGGARRRVELPVEAQPKWSRGDTLWASVPDDYGVPWLVRFEVVEG